MTAGCAAALRGGILYLTLDSPGSSVNVVTPALAAELEARLARGLAAGARAVVLQSAKRGSFVRRSPAITGSRATATTRTST